MQQQNTTPRKRTKYWIVLALLLTAYTIYPYSSLYRLTKGLEEGNKETLRSLVNWKNLRTSIKDELNASLSADLIKKQDHKATGFEGLGTALVATFLPKMIDGMIDSIVTPAGLAKMIGNAKSKEPDAHEAHTESNHEDQKETNNIIKQIRYAFFSDLATFRVEFGNENDDPDNRVVAMLELQSGSWKLNSISLPDRAQPLSRHPSHRKVTAVDGESAGGEKKPEHSAETAGKMKIPSERAQKQKKSTPKPQPKKEVVHPVINSTDMIRQQFMKCWNVPAGARDAHSLVVVLRVKLSPNGLVQSVELAGDRQRYYSDTFFRAAADSAMRAVNMCSPLQSLPAQDYDGWKEVVLKLDPADMLY